MNPKQLLSYKENHLPADNGEKGCLFGWLILRFLFVELITEERGVWLSVKDKFKFIFINVYIVILMTSNLITKLLTGNDQITT